MHLRNLNQSNISSQGHFCNCVCLQCEPRFQRHYENFDGQLDNSNTENVDILDHSSQDETDNSVPHSYARYIPNHLQSLSSGVQVDHKDHSNVEIVDHSSNNPGKLSMNVRNNVPKTDAMIVINTIPENNDNTNDDTCVFD